MVLEVVLEDMGEDSMHCTQHPFKNSSPGGICAFCLQEKLGNLVSSSFPVPIFPTTSSSPTASFRSDFGGACLTNATTTTTTTSTSITTTSSALALHHTSSTSSKLPFLFAQRRRKEKKNGMMGGSGLGSSNNMVFQRSKSTTTPRNHMHFGDGKEEYNPKKKGFWSFFYSSSSKHSKKLEKAYKDYTFASSSSSSSTVTAPPVSSGKINNEFIVLEENDGSPDQASFDRKVSRSRSVGCGSRSFSGDFFERISTGLGDCALRRVESQREGKNKNGMHRNGKDCIMKERVRCGGLFGGFMMITSSSSSSSSSSYLVSSSSAEDKNMNGRIPGNVGTHLAHGRSKSWGWAFASPMRAFSSKQTSNGKKIDQNNKNATPDLAAIPSLLAVKSKNNKYSP